METNKWLSRNKVTLVIGLYFEKKNYENSSSFIELKSRVLSLHVSDEQYICQGMGVACFHVRFREIKQMKQKSSVNHTTTISTMGWKNKCKIIVEQHIWRLTKPYWCPFFIGGAIQILQNTYVNEVKSVYRKWFLNSAHTWVYIYLHCFYYFIVL